ncbi:hypothetical protein [Ancylobacter lacus]|uniref:hypothetical protein n=1 Tax=Ancylobacter lacus TaxID=2579970 RepID=UPI001BCD0168|nr:hypothetical protein [Ancylobacter lacus]
MDRRDTFNTCTDDVPAVEGISCGPGCVAGAACALDADDLPGLIAAFNSREEMREDWQARDESQPWTENWWFADATTIEREDWNLSASRYRPESREAAEHRDPRALLAELRDETAAILGDIEALAAELGEPVA